MQRVHEVVIPNQVKILQAFRKAGENICHTIIESLTADGRDRSLDHKLSNMHVPKGAPEGAIIAPLTPTEYEPVLPKTSSGLFNSTNADYVLRNLNTRFLVIAGIVTDQCVDMAVRDAADRGYLVTVVKMPAPLTRQNGMKRPCAPMVAIAGSPTPKPFCRALRPLANEGIMTRPEELVTFVTTDIAAITRAGRLPPPACRTPC